MNSYSEEELQETQKFPSTTTEGAVPPVTGRFALRPAPGAPAAQSVPAGSLPLSPDQHDQALKYELVKRALDIAGAGSLLLLILPLMGVIAALIVATSPGPVLFRQIRLGRHGVQFWLYKFRSMVPNAERQLDDQPDLRRAFEESFKLAVDPRVTPLGALLRRSSLDELPQLFNVLRGSMSLIGPRPIVPKELIKYGDHGQKLLSVKPGLGGYWQAHGRSDTSYTERITLDMFYIDRRSLGMDFALLGKTALAVLRRRGSC